MISRETENAKVERTRKQREKSREKSGVSSENARSAAPKFFANVANI